jgi:hypothetical protein
MGTDLNALRAIAENPEGDIDGLAEAVLAVAEDLDSRLTSVESKLSGSM